MNTEAMPAQGPVDVNVSPLPCPFCGGKPQGPYKVGGGDERTGYSFSMKISCACGASIDKPSHHDKQGWCDDRGRATADVLMAWNKRANANVTGLAPAQETTK